jgi:1-acyl-sn-glycerol-3-phosphate acyltransferase
MGKQELFRNPVFHWVLDRFGGFPVERGTADRAALRRARSILANGLALGMFPEGGRSRTGAMIEGHAGVGLLALQSQSPILPVGIYGTEFFPVNGEWPPRRSRTDVRGVAVVIGAPFEIPNIVDGRRVTSVEATRLIMTRIAQLLPVRYRGVYASDAGQAPGKEL